MGFWVTHAPGLGTSLWEPLTRLYPPSAKSSPFLFLSREIRGTQSGLLHLDLMHCTEVFKDDKGVHLPVEVCMNSKQKLFTVEKEVLSPQLWGKERRGLHSTLLPTDSHMFPGRKVCPVLPELQRKVCLPNVCTCWAVTESRSPWSCCSIRTIVLPWQRVTPAFLCCPVSWAGPWAQRNKYCAPLM